MYSYLLSLVVFVLYLAVLFYALGILAYFIKAIQAAISNKENINDSLGKLLYVIFLPGYGYYHIESSDKTNEKKKTLKNIIAGVVTICGLCMIILPKIGKGTETVGSLFENEKYISYHYATLKELDDDYEPTSVEIFGIAEVERDEDTRWIKNIYVENYGTFHAWSSDPIEVFQAPINISDIDGKKYEVKVLTLKPELRELDDEIATKVAGVTFNNDDGENRQEILRKIKSGDKTITLVRDKENPHDKNAVRVNSKYGMIGFLDKETAKLVSYLLDYGNIVNATITQITGGNNGNYYGCNILLKFYRAIENENYRPEPEDDYRN